MDNSSGESAVTDAEVAAALDAIRAEDDPGTKHFRVAALVSGLFRAQGADPVVVGGSAVEFYTEGAYVSGDLDICFTGVVLPSMAQRMAVVKRLGAEALSSRQCLVEGVYVDLLGSLETTARTPFQQIGAVKLVPVEDLVVERIYAAHHFPTYHAEREAVAKILLRIVLDRRIEADQAEIRRLAESPDYGVGEELARLSREIAAEAVRQPIERRSDEHGPSISPTI